MEGMFLLSFPPPLPSPSPPLTLSFPPLPSLSFFFPSPPLPLEVGSPLNQLGLEGLGGAVTSPSGVRGAAPAENEFGAL